MARKHKHPEHVNHERWLVSYADFITLLFAFFTTLYAISTLDTKKMSDLVKSVQTAMGHMGAQRTVIDPTMPNPWHQTGTQPNHPPGGSKRPDRALAELAQSLSKVASSFGGDARFSVRVQPNGVVLTLSDAVLFGPGDARLRRQALPVLDAIARMLLQNPHAVVVEGHTDDRPGVMPTANWRLSTDRAINVLSYFVEEHGYPPSRLAAAGYGQYHPLGDNDNEEGRSRNRRVELVILQDSKVPPEYQR